MAKTSGAPAADSARAESGLQNFSERFLRKVQNEIVPATQAAGRMVVEFGALMAGARELCSVLGKAASAAKGGIVLSLGATTAAGAMLPATGGVALAPFAVTLGAAAWGGAETGRRIAAYQHNARSQKERQQHTLAAAFRERSGIASGLPIRDFSYQGPWQAENAAVDGYLDRRHDDIRDRSVSMSRQKAGTTSAASAGAAEDFLSGIRDQIGYLGADGREFLPVLEEWGARLKPLSEEWKRVKDLQLEITSLAEEQEQRVFAAMEERQRKGEGIAAETHRSYWDNQAWMTEQGLMDKREYLAKLGGEFENLGGRDALAGLIGWSEELKEVFTKLQAVAGESVGQSIASLGEQFAAGTITGEEYAAALNAVVEEFGYLPHVLAMSNEELGKLDEQRDKTGGALEKLVNAANRDLTKGLEAIPARIGDAFTAAIVSGEDLGEVFKSLLQDIGTLIVKAVVMNALFGSSGSGGILGGFLGAVIGSADGNVFVGGRIVPFATGGIVSAPTLFPMSNGTGLMGEAGPEGILPLKRIGGVLGVHADLAGAAASQDVAVNVINQSGMPLDVVQSDIRRDPVTRVAVVEIVVDNYRRNGAIRQAMRQG